MITRSLGRLLRTWLLTGLLVLVPFAVTATVTFNIFQFLDSWIHKFGIDFPGAGLAVLVLVTLLVGFLFSYYIGKKLLSGIEFFILRIPGIGIVYRLIRDFSRTFFDANKKPFKHVVCIEFPSDGKWAVGFITGDPPQALSTVIGQEIVMVFIMMAFSPATGFLIAVPKTKVRQLDMPVEDAMKLILTGGMVKTADPVQSAAEPEHAFVM